ncbi:Thiol-disulfide isomerase or thioredoxin [Tistlia consotensis]|uniref:Thiol-disulfide isomerase or thioredoxin n=1 Tax=Tistlia consotensis USBA 355 TaxID=560819 RepID=A0A1Y6BSQ7_9PROT|nr:TlpA disulfide reductase family protein [Tistlia consotensis]SMF26474.1 Thiol-disulfide isomerase or thioredoxin [Tistlia consotensis USBA 355]SNR67138.1 Thiol-disulfide isomerase or thioredoxin [Tistlia consotensis]
MARLTTALFGLCLAALAASIATGAGASAPVLRSRSGQFIFLSPLDPAPETAFQTLDGSMTDLGQFRGRVVVLNFWASWCLPCAYEMTSLDRLAAASDPNRLAVVAVSIDRDGAQAVFPFVVAHHLIHLPVYLDPGQRLGSLSRDRMAEGALPLWGLPITYIIDMKGEVVGYIVGATDWDSPEARRFLRYFLGQPEP